MLGYRKVGFIFCQSVKAQKAAAEGDYIINTEELISMAAMQVSGSTVLHTVNCLSTPAALLLTLVPPGAPRTRHLCTPRLCTPRPVPPNSTSLIAPRTTQDEIGEHCCTALVTQYEEDSGPQVHFEAFQCRWGPGRRPGSVGDGEGAGAPRGKDDVCVATTL